MLKYFMRRDNMLKNSKHYKTKTADDFERLQQSYSRGYFELYKKYFVEKEKVRKATIKLDTMFANGIDEAILDDLLELSEILKSDKVKIDVEYVKDV